MGEKFNRWFSAKLLGTDRFLLTIRAQWSILLAGFFLTLECLYLLLIITQLVLTLANRWFWPVNSLELQTFSQFLLLSFGFMIPHGLGLAISLRQLIRTSPQDFRDAVVLTTDTSGYEPKSKVAYHGCFSDTTDTFKTEKALKQGDKLRLVMLKSNSRWLPVGLYNRYLIDLHPEQGVQLWQSTSHVDAPTT